MIMRDDELAAMMRQQDEEESQKLTEKEQRDMSLTPKVKNLVLVQRVLSLQHFLQSYIPQNLGFPSKVTTLAMDSMFFFADRLLHIQPVFIVAGIFFTVEVG